MRITGDDINNISRKLRNSEVKIHNIHSYVTKMLYNETITSSIEYTNDYLTED
jgi:hypothetical protein